MKKTIYVFLVLAFCISLFHCKDAYAAKRKHIIEFFNEEGVIETYIPDIKNSSGDNNVNVGALKNLIEEALAARRSHTLDIVSSEASADIIVEVDVVEYFWTEEDPVDLVFSPIAAGIDKAKDENYARMQVDIIVRNAKNGRELWNDRVQSTITDGTMEKDESYGRSYERIAKNFTKKLFKKPKRRR